MCQLNSFFDTNLCNFDVFFFRLFFLCAFADFFFIKLVIVCEIIFPCKIKKYYCFQVEHIISNPNLLCI